MKDVGLVDQVMKMAEQVSVSRRERGDQRDRVPHPYWLNDVLGWFAQPCVLHFAAIVVA